ncbi:SDR family oxidoreductase [Paraglaciecola arctica]|uniref:Oxidoreductase, short chain dehydrogenase/reductase family protein n=1 Tax=Paraglaciecola arctica BSs20135 TaxID=493475 RepID=K6X972_9ALTE|nr:SDR family oxidoreductase [Paraglaciecola arctica]GAC17179.1 oxidoreductase, short chain dehydrogenase/reductase family protein [Paraglaciecola arctica BSs20135]
MELQDKIIVITGAGSGIGRALAVRFHAQGAKKIIAVDINLSNAQDTANMVNGVAMMADVAKEDDISRVIEETEANIGAIDLFCSNAGVALGENIDSSNSEWQASWDINVMSHVYAARHLVPRMAARGGGYLLNTASAAGLLNQIGGAAYGVTKHAAVGFGEWLAIHHKHEGIKVSMLCPQAVKTPMTAVENDAIAAAASNGMIEPEELAECVVEELRKESFLILPHPIVLEYMRNKTSNYDRWIGGMNKLMRHIMGIGK